MHIKPLITALLCAVAAGPTFAQDDGALMLAAKLNIGEKLAAECDTLKPGTLREYQAHLKAIEAAFKGRLDVSATARQHTETIPEVASAGYVQKFRKKSPEAKQASCAATMASIRQDARDAAEMSAGKR